MKTTRVRLLIFRLTAVSRAVVLSSRWWAVLGVKPREWTRFFLKSANLSLCYSAFRNGFDFNQAIGAGTAAFLCSAYDVVTDWRHFDPIRGRVFSGLLARYTTQRLSCLAQSLYDAEMRRELSEDGLERGVVAFRFVIAMMGIEQVTAEEYSIHDLGRTLQLIDDLLDFESDSKSGDKNCLSSTRSLEFLREGVALTQSRLAPFLLRDSILARVTEAAVKKATYLSECCELRKPLRSFQISQPNQRII